jgi:hypothetical protein
VVDCVRAVQLHYKFVEVQRDIIRREGRWSKRPKRLSDGQEPGISPAAARLALPAGGPRPSRQGGGESLHPSQEESLRGAASHKRGSQRVGLSLPS